MRAFVGGNLLIAEDCKPKDCTGTYCTPIKGQMINKTNQMAQFRCSACCKKIANQHNSCNYQVYQFCSMKKAGIVSSNVLIANIVKFL